MKNPMKLLAALLALPLVAWSAPMPADQIDNIVAQIEDVMGQGMCAVSNDTTDYGTQTITVLLPKPIGARKILVNDYNWFRSGGYAKGPSGLFLMSERAKQALSADADSDRSLAVRALFSSKPPAVRPPGNGVRFKP